MSKRIHLLYVDDDPSVADVVELFLERRGFAVERASSGTDALSRLADEDLRVECIVSDYSMPRMNGLELLEAVRERDVDVPFVLFTGTGNEQVASKAVSAGISDYVLKTGGSGQYDVLASRIETLVENHRNERRVATVERRQRETFERMTDAVFSVDGEWRITYWNQQMAERVDRSADEVLGEVLWEAFPPLAGTDLETRLRKVMRTNESVTFETYVDLTGRWVEIRVYPDENGLSVYSTDISDRVERERTLEREHAYLREFYDVSTSSTLSFAEKLDSLLELGCEQFSFDIGILSRIEDATYEVRAVHTPDGGIDVGDTFDLEATYCEEVVAADAPSSFADAAEAGKHAHPAYREFGLESYLGVPVLVEGEPYGTLNFSSPTPREEAVSDAERVLIQVLAEWVGNELESLRDRERIERHRDLLDKTQRLARVGGWQLDLRTGELDWTEETVRIHGMPAEYEPELETAVEFYHPDDQATITDAVNRAITQGVPFDHTLRITGGDGDLRWVRSVGQPIVEDGSVVLLRGAIQDVTRRVERERTLTETSERLEALVESSPVAIMAIDDAGDVTLWNPAAERLFGWSPEEVLYEFNPLIPPEKRGEHSEFRKRAFAGEALSQVEIERQTKDGTRIDLTLSTAPIHGETGEVEQVVAFLDDITERKQRERAIADREQRLSKIIDGSTDAITIKDRQGRYLLANDAGAAYLGRSPSEVIGRTDDELQPLGSDAIRTIREHDRAVIETGETKRREEVIEIEGARYVFESLRVPYRGPADEVIGVISIWHDVTERERIERRLRALQRTARELNAASSAEEVGRIAVEAADDVLDLHLTAIWRYDDQEKALLPLAHTPEAGALFGDQPRFDDGPSLVREAFENGEFSVCDDLEDVDGRYNPDTVLRSEIIAPLDDRGVMSTGTTEPQAFTEVEVDLFRVLAATVQAAMVRAEREEALRHREVELQAQNARLDEFASIVSHDLRNPLTIATWRLELAEEDSPSPHHENLRHALDRMDALIEDVLLLARSGRVVRDPTPVDFREVVEDAWETVDTRRIDLSLDGLDVIEADGERVRTLFENLFRNAVEHGDPETIRVGTLVDGGGFYIEDDGSGIPSDVLPEMFEYGFSTDVGGTGFGLAIVENVVESHGWHITATNGEAGGARFEVTTALPESPPEEHWISDQPS